MANAVTFWKGTRAAYDALPAEKILDTRIYFCEDTGEILKGGVRFSRDISAVKFQGNEVSSGVSSINFTGIGNVTSDADGNITVRLGENLNCSTWNTTDGISKATVTGSYSSTGATANVTPSSTFSDTSAASVRACRAGDTPTYSISATSGSTATSASGANTNNGNEVHFDDNTSCYFKVKIVEGKNTDATEYLVGPIAANNTYYGYIDSTEYKGIKCVISNFGEEPKKANGATGYSGNVSFTILPETLYADKSTDFQLTGIDLVKGTGDTKTIVGTWPATSTNAKHFFLSAKDDNGDAVTYGTGMLSSTATNPAAYTLTKGTAVTYHGVTYYKAADSKVSATCAAKNIGFPASVSSKSTMTATGGTWFSSVTDTATSKFTPWTDAKDTEMKYTSTAATLNIGDWTGIGINLKGVNYIGTQNTALAIPVSEKLLICDANGYITNDHGPFTMSTAALGATELMVFDGCLVYPSRDFSSYTGNSGYAVPAAADRHYTKEFSLVGTKTGGTITIAHKSASGVKDALADGTMKVQVRTKGGEWRDASEKGIGQSTSTYESTSTKLDFVFAFDTDYPNASTGTAVRITMSSAVADIKSITLA